MNWFTPMLRLELARQPKRWQLVLLSCNLFVAVFVSWLTPKLSPSVLGFLGQIFKMDNLTEMVLLNDYLGFYMIVFWLIFFEVLAILVIPAEEGYLSIWLSKPLSRRRYLLTRLVPVLGVAVLLDLILILGSAVAVLTINGDSDFGWARFLAASSISLTLGVLMAMLTQGLLLWLRDTYNAMIVAFACWLLPILPSSLYMYRPDLFDANPLLRWLIVFPANLIWLKDDVILLALLLVPVLLLLSGGLIWLTAWQMERLELS
ncbi:MAG: hypothetical protein CVV27_19195 [Candidatus Melainabacteria bacterium HGW-Melainabacteria-1]|nr:MAG: hypothetical protein CVV27_19195 [Candidatus Melainabacteria bacterium HGW-Melainabacteria-1]